MSNVKLQASASGTGTVTIAPPVTNSDLTINLPANSGTVPTIASVVNNGVVYTNSTGAITSSSALTFDGTNLGVGTSSPGERLTVAATANNAGRFTSTATTTALVLDNTNANGWGSNIAINTGGVAAGYFGTIGSLLGSTAQDLAVYANTGNGFRVYTNGNNERLRLDSSGNLGLGVTPSAWSGSLIRAIQIGDNNASISSFTTGNTSADWLFLNNNAYYDGSWKYTASSTAAQYAITANEHRWYNAPSGTAGNAISFTQAMTLDASGQLAVGTSTPNANTTLTLNRAGFNQFYMQVGGTNRLSLYADTAVSAVDAQANPLALYAGSAERARITSGGNLLVGTSTDDQRLTVVKDANGAYVARFTNTTSSNANGVYINTPNRAGDGALFGLTVANSGGNAFAIYTNGTYGTISDINRKKNVETTRNGYLTDLCALRVVKYNWKEQEDSEPKELGFIAQEIEQVFAGLVQTDDNGQKMVKQPVLIPMLVKAIQELKAEFDAYKATHP